MEKPELDVHYEDWHAIHDHMGETLRVYGTCIVPGAGFAIELGPPSERGFNPRMLMLELRLMPTGESPSRQSAEYQQPWTNAVEYDEVGFVIVNDLVAPSPPTLQIEDVY